jgi:hypothetical protein
MSSSKMGLVGQTKFIGTFVVIEVSYRIYETLFLETMNSRTWRIWSN